MINDKLEIYASLVESGCNGSFYEVTVNFIDEADEAYFLLLMSDVEI